jgi:ribosomal protein S12 methylthiotransferase accessory factor
MEHRIILKDVFKGYTYDLDKAVTPEETLRRFREKLRKAQLDILEETVRIDKGRLDIPVYFSVCGPHAQEAIGTKKQMGKGGTPEQAEASAVMELAERFSLFTFYRDPRNFFVDTYKNVKDRALPFDTIAQSVHDEDSEELANVYDVFARLPLMWTWGYNLSRETEVLVPFDWFFTINQFNGSTAGNCTEEAVLQGICEVVERHVSSIVSRNRLRTPALDLDSVTDEITTELIRKFRTVGVRVCVTDFSLDTGIPTVGVLAYDPQTFPARSEIVWTAGTTPDPQKSLCRALTEIAQLAGDFNSSSNYVASGLPKFKTLAEADFVLKSDRTVSVSDLPDLSNENIRVEVENCVAALERLQMDVLLVDITHSKLDIPAYYVISPGAHFRERAVGTSVGMFSAKLIAERGNPQWALRELEKMDKALPNKYYVKFFQGVACLSGNRPEEGLPFLEKALRLDPPEQDIPSIYSYMGVCLKEMGQYRKAIDTLEKAGSLDRERTDVLNLMGYCYFKLKEHERAIACFQRLLQLDPTSAIDYANIASNYRDIGNTEEAIRYYRFALELDSGIDFARENLDLLEKKRR